MCVCVCVCVCACAGVRVCVCVGVWVLYFKNQPQTYKQIEGQHKHGRDKGKCKQGEYIELHHVSTSTGHADCHKKPDANDRPNM